MEADCVVKRMTSVEVMGQRSRKWVVITGATGAIGRALLRASIEAGYEVLAIVHRASARVKGLEDIEHCTVLAANPDEYESVPKKMAGKDMDADGFELFFHLAWRASFGQERENLTIQLENVDATLRAVQLAKSLGCFTFIGIGSQAEYGRREGLLSPQTPAFPETGYGIAKLCAGQMARLSCEQLGLRYIWCRVLSVYGPYDREQTLICTAVRQMLANNETQFTPCEQLWDYLYSDDAAQAILVAARQGKSGSVYVVGSGETHPLHEYIETIAALTGYSRKIGFGKLPYNEKQVMFLQADIQALEVLGFQRKVSFEEGIRRTIAWQNKKKQNIG